MSMMVDADEVRALRELTDSEKETLLAFFAKGDYVFDLTPRAFFKLAKERAGVALYCDGNFSVGEALRNYVMETGHPDKTLALLFGLSSYYRNRYQRQISNNTERAKCLIECERIVSDAMGTGVALHVESSLLDNPMLSHLKRQIVIAQKAIDEGLFPEALVNAKSALEGVAKFALKGMEVKVRNESHVTAWFAAFKQAYRISDGVRVGGGAFSEVVSGLCRSVEAIEFIRNKSSTAHGRAEPDPPIEECQARLYVNSVVAICDFILSVVAERESEKSCRVSP